MTSSSAAPQPSSTPKTIADAYLAVWNEDDGARRRILLQGWAETCRYTDPLTAGEGRGGVAAMIEAVRTQFPGYLFSLRGTPDGYGVHVRFGWTLAPLGGAPIARGTDIVRLDGAGSIVEVVGFLDGGTA